MTSSIITGENGNNIKHITPAKCELSTIYQGKISCTEPKCQQVFTLLQNMELHVMQTHRHKKFKTTVEKGYEKRFYCPVEKCIYQYTGQCGGKVKYFKKQKYVKQHYLKVHADKIFHCNSCKQSFSTAAYLTAHKISCSKDMVCSCGKTFGSIPSLQTHVRRSHHEATILNSSEKKNITATSKTDIQSRNQCSHITAAIALSELAVARFKRISTVDIGMQTEVPSHKRSAKRLLTISPKEYGNMSKVRKTTETESQTNLTNLKKKKPRKMRSISTSSCTFNSTTNKRPDKLTSSKPEAIKLPDKFNSSHELYDAQVQWEGKNIMSQFCMQSNTDEFICNEVTDFSVIDSKYDSMSSINSSGNQHNDVDNDYGKFEQSSATTENICSPKTELDNLSRPYSYMSYDVFLNSNLPSISGSLTSSETQTDSYNLWCSSETQTCEDFSDIEQFMCSTIHTQTAGSIDDLFPDLNFTDT